MTQIKNHYAKVYTRVLDRYYNYKRMTSRKVIKSSGIKVQKMMKLTVQCLKTDNSRFHINSRTFVFSPFKSHSDSYRITSVDNR